VMMRTGVDELTRYIGTYPRGHHSDHIHLADSSDQETPTLLYLLVAPRDSDSR